MGYLLRPRFVRRHLPEILSSVIRRGLSLDALEEFLEITKALRRARGQEQRRLELRREEVLRRLPNLLRPAPALNGPTPQKFSCDVIPVEVYWKPSGWPARFLRMLREGFLRTLSLEERWGRPPDLEALVGSGKGEWGRTLYGFGPLEALRPAFSYLSLFLPWKTEVVSARDLHLLESWALRILVWKPSEERFLEAGRLSSLEPLGPVRLILDLEVLGKCGSENLQEGRRVRLPEFLMGVEWEFLPSTDSSPRNEPESIGGLL